MAMTKKEYEVIAEAIMNVRRRVQSAFDEGTIPWSVADTVCDQMAEEIGEKLRARHRGAYAWKQSRWDEATGTRS